MQQQAHRIKKSVTFPASYPLEIILLAGALGCVSLWGAVFADVGVALLAVLNAIRILYKKF